MDRRTKFASMAIDELWVVREELTEVLKAKLSAEKKDLERRLASLNTVTGNAQTRRPYPPVLPKFANPDEPRQVWSGRGKQPHWVKQKLASGLVLQDLRIARPRRPRLVIG